MAKPKIKRPAPSSRRKKEDTRFFIGALIIIGALLVAGIVFAIFFGPTTTSPHQQVLQSELQGSFGQQLKSEGASNWELRGQNELAITFGEKWDKTPKEKQISAMTQIGQDWQNLVSAHGGSNTPASLTYYNKNKKVIATWDSTTGLKVTEK